MTVRRVGTAARIALASALCVGVFFLAVPVTSCGGEDGPVCGDRVVEGIEECDDGNDVDLDFCSNSCTIRFLTIKWAFNKAAVEEFSNDNCTNMGALDVQVEVVGPVSVTQIEGCPLLQTTFGELPNGTYVVKVTPRDNTEQSLVKAPVERTISLGPSPLEIEIVVRPEDWANSYTGTFFFHTRWGGNDCATALPPVVDHRFLLEVDGVPVSQLTWAGDTLDGSATGPCYSAEETRPQSALGVPFGYATFTVSGYDVGAQKQFEQSIDTFVGAGISNPVLVFDIDSLYPDASVPDASMADAGVSDAAVSDAAVYDAAVYDAP